jgi:RNA polymerase-binding protein DksA
MKKSSKKVPQRAEKRPVVRAAAKPQAKSEPKVARPAKPEPKVAPKAQAKAKAPVRAVAAPPPPPAAKRELKPPKVNRAAARKRAARFRDLLVTRHRALLAAYRSGKGSTRETATDGTEDYIDYAVNSYDRDFMLSLTEMEQRQILQIEEALRRIDRGEYGYCLQCGQEIPEKRLEVEPWARHCVRCQELEEQGLLLQQQGHGFDTDYDDEPRAEEAPEVEEEAEPDEEVSEDVPEIESDRDDDDELNA